MKDRFKPAFDSVHAEEELKARTLDTIMEHMPRRRSVLRPIPAGMCLLLLVCIMLGSYKLYYTPTTVVSIDVNPSMELEVNRFDKVISFSGTNEEGDALADSLSIGNMDYKDAMASILASSGLSQYRQRGDVISLSVVDFSYKQQCREVYTAILQQISGSGGIYCYKLDSDLHEGAHSVGLSYGKYRAYLVLSSLEPCYTPEDVAGMTMAEIYSLIEGLGGDPSALPGKCACTSTQCLCSLQKD